VLDLNEEPPRAEEWQRPDEWLEDSSEIELSDRTLRVLHTPGHTTGHVVFHDEANQLYFTGDHVLPHITPSIGFETTLDPGHPLEAFLTSLAMLRSRPDGRMLPAHGNVGPSVHARVADLERHHADRLSQCAAQVESQGRTAYEVAVALPWTRRGRAFSSLDPTNRMLAAIETQAHLDVLVNREQLDADLVDGVSVYRTRRKRWSVSTSASASQAAP
jgi:glyoxylase-like metal-dependent hydrolase (beta-lactamase superfamily II)